MKTSLNKTTSKVSATSPIQDPGVFSPEGFDNTIYLHQWLAVFKEGQKRAYDKEIALFKARILKAQEVSDKLHNWLEAKSGCNSRSFLKIIDIYTFETIHLINLDSYLNAEFRKQAYDLTFELSKEFNNSDFRIDFHLTDDSESINFELLESNGFMLTHSGN
jgi:hypothetical protein